MSSAKKNKARLDSAIEKFKKGVTLNKELLD
jgi:exonuclease VII small subunit